MKLLILFYCIYIAKAIGVTLPWWAYGISAAVFAVSVYGEIIDKEEKS